MTLLPPGIVRSLVSTLLVKALSVRPEERLFWHVLLRASVHFYISRNKL